MVVEETKELDWEAIENRRNLMLVKSDWTQLPDADLSANCVSKWRKWRRELRQVRIDQYEKRIDATMELNHLSDNQPVNDYNLDTYDNLWEKEGAIVNRLDLTTRIKDILEEIGMLRGEMPPIEPTESPSETVSLDDAKDIQEARKIASGLIHEAHDVVLSGISPPLAQQTLYSERLSQAIDLLTGSSTIVPLLEVIGKHSNIDTNTIAKNTISKHRDIITALCIEEGKFLSTLVEIGNVDNIDKLRKIVRIYGH